MWRSITRFLIHINSNINLKHLNFKIQRMDETIPRNQNKKQQRGKQHNFYTLSGNVFCCYIIRKIFHLQVKLYSQLIVTSLFYSYTSEYKIGKNDWRIAFLTQESRWNIGLPPLVSLLEFERHRAEQWTVIFTKIIVQK